MLLYQISEEDTCHSGQGCSSYNPDCLECKLQRHMAQQSSVPESVLKVNIFICIICFKCQPTQVFEDAIADAENGLTGWLTYVNSYRIVMQESLEFCNQIDRTPTNPGKGESVQESSGDHDRTAVQIHGPGRILALT